MNIRVINLTQSCKHCQFFLLKFNSRFKDIFKIVFKELTGNTYEKYHSFEKNKVEIDILLKQNLSMREVGRRLGISHSTISRYKAGIYKKRKIDINKNLQTITVRKLYSHGASEIYYKKNK